MGKPLAGKFLLAGAFIACPCHIPIYGVLLGGGVLGAYFAERIGTVLALMTALFLVSLWWGLRLLRSHPDPPS